MLVLLLAFDIDAGSEQFACALTNVMTVVREAGGEAESIGRLTIYVADKSEYSADLKAVGKASCTVSNARIIGKTAKGTTYMEVACSDGLKGYVMEYTAELKPIEAIGCAFSGQCKLPGNT